MQAASANGRFSFFLHRSLLPALLISGWLLSGQAMASSDTALAGEQRQRLGHYDVHYSAFNSTFLTTKMARSYGLTRSRYNAVINISVQDAAQPGQPAVKAEISGTARNLLGNSKSLTFREITEGDAVYYLSEVSFSNEETFRFTLDIKVAEGPSHQLKFQQKLYAD